MAKYEVGQTVWVYENFRRNTPPVLDVVTKVGRLLVTVGKGYGARQFRIENGRLNDKNFSSHSSIMTEEEKVASERRSAVTQALIGLGIQFKLGMQNKFSTETLERIAEVIRDSQE